MTDLLLRPLPPVDRIQTVGQALAEFVDASALMPGDRLPAERELMATLKAGRSTVREVLRQWQALGVVEARKGSGTYLRRRVSTATVHMPLSLETRQSGLLHMLEVRRGLETEAAALAAVRATAAALANIEAKLTLMEAIHLREGCAGPEDLAFHLSIYEACGNPLFGQLLAQMRGSLQTLFAMSDIRRDFAARSFPFHRLLFNAIKARDPEEARRQTLAILAIVAEDIKLLKT